MIGIGGGGDVVGALATAEACRLYHGAQPVVGGVSWERRPIDPQPGPRAEEEIESFKRLAAGVLLANPATRVRESGVRFCETRMAEFLGESTLLVDVTRGPRDIAASLRDAISLLGCDLAVFVDVGGDVLGHGDEAGLASPLCDAVMLAAAGLLEEEGPVPVLAGLFGLGCDGELTPEEALERLAEVAAAGGGAGSRGLTAQVVSRLDEAVQTVPTEASAQALRAFYGVHGPVPIREGRRTVPLSPIAAGTFYFEVGAALRSAARLAAAVRDAADLEEANTILEEMGVRTELRYERSL